jgi:hypothetical protein
MPESALGSGDGAMNKTHKLPAVIEFIFLVLGMGEYRQTNI